MTSRVVRPLGCKDMVTRFTLILVQMTHVDGRLHILEPVMKGYNGPSSNSTNSQVSDIRLNYAMQQVHFQSMEV